MKIEPKTFILKLHYFLHGAGAAPINPYLPIIIKQMGMTVSSMGPIIFSIQILGLILKPLFGSLLDRSRRKNIVFQLAILGSFSYYGLNILPPSGTFQEVFNLKAECSHEKHLSALVTEAIVPDLCLKHKFNSIYRDTDFECDFHCIEPHRPDYRFTGQFTGKMVDLIHKGHLRVTLKEKMNQGCRPELRCSARCPKFPDAQNVLNNYMTKSRYLIVVAIWIIGQVCYSVVNSIQDAVCQRICHNLEESKAYYGQQRTWCSVGYGLSAILMGNFMDHYNESNLVYDYSPVFNLLLFLWSFDIILVGFLKIPDSNLVRDVNNGIMSSKTNNPLKGVWTLISTRKSVLVYLLYVISVGFCYGALCVHMLFLEDLGQRSDCNGSWAMKTLGGLVLLFHTLGEFPIFLYSHKFEAKLGSQGMMSVVLLTFAFRFFYYSVLQSPWAILLMELMSGLTTGLFWPAISSYNMSIAPENSSATMLSVTYAIFDALGVGVGGLLATLLYDLLGGRFLFLLYGIFAMTAFILHRLAQTYVYQSSSSKKHSLEDTKSLL